MIIFGRFQIIIYEAIVKCFKLLSRHSLGATVKETRRTSIRVIGVAAKMPTEYQS